MNRPCFCTKIAKSPDRGRGVFALCDFQPGDLIEECPGILVEGMPSGILGDYLFGTGYDGYSVNAMGWCSVYNHSDTPTAEWETTGDVDDPTSWTVTVRATSPILRGDEIFISYGPNYWSTRPHIVQR